MKYFIEKRNAVLNLTERNKIVEKRTKCYISYLGLKGRLEMEPIPNSFKRRPRYYVDADGVFRFSAFLWQMNKLNDEELAEDIAIRVNAARHYFGI